MDDRIQDIWNTVWKEFRNHEFWIKYSVVVKYYYALIFIDVCRASIHES